MLFRSGSTRPTTSLYPAPRCDTFAIVDRAPAAVRLPPATRLALACLCAAALAAAPALPAAAWALPPPPVRLAVIWGRAPWEAGSAVRLPPPPERWQASWAGEGEPALPDLPRSPDGRT